MNKFANSPCAEAHTYLCKSTKECSELLSKNINSTGVLKLSVQADMGLCTFLGRTVVGQQLSTSAARTIWKRVENQAEKNHLSVESIFNPSYDQTLKACGISGSKRKALFGIAEAINSEAVVDLELRLKAHEERSAQLTEIWGIGQWTADMTSMFYYGDPDIWPSSDGAVLRGIKLFANGSVRKEKNIIKVAAPYRSYLALHMWNAVDSGLM